MKTSTFLSLCAVWATAKASPLVIGTSEYVRRDVTVTDTDLANFKLFAQYSAASYCANNDDSSNTPITCSSSACPLVEAAEATSVVEFNSTTRTGEEGFVAVDPTNQLVVVSFRGSSSIRNWIADLAFGLEPTSLCAGCFVHSGFLNAWEETMLSVISGINAARAANPTFSVVVTGHSLGGAVATLAGAYLRASGIPCTIYTYGSPRVGNAAFADFVTNQQQSAGGGLSTFRITHFDDPVPRLPPLLLTYRHTSPEFWLATGGATSVNFTPTDIRICLGIGNTSCNAATAGLDVTAHLFYLGPISSCAPALSLKRDEEDDLAKLLANLAEKAEAERDSG